MALQLVIARSPKDTLPTRVEAVHVMTSEGGAQ